MTTDKAERLAEEVRKFQDSTGEEGLLVQLFDDEDNICGIHHIGWVQAVGLTVDGRPATFGFYHELQGWKALQELPVLH